MATVESCPQAGIVNHPPDHVLVMAVGQQATRPNSARTTVESLRQLIRLELESDLGDQTAQTSKADPPIETGERGFADGFDRFHLTIAESIHTKPALMSSQ